MRPSNEERAGGPERDKHTKTYKHHIFTPTAGARNYVGSLQTLHYASHGDRGRRDH